MGGYVKGKGTDDVKVIVVGNGFDKPGSNPRHRQFAFHFVLMPLGKV